MKRDLVGRGKVMARSIAHRLTGFSIPVFGVQWNPPADEQDIVRRLFVALEDRRVLFVPEYLEVPSEVTASVLRIRELLTERLQELPKDSAAAGSIRAMRAACRRFLDEPRPNFRNIHPNRRAEWIEREEFDPGFFVALGELRATFGTHIAALACQYGIDVQEELAVILPSLVEPEAGQ